MRQSCTRLASALQLLPERRTLTLFEQPRLDSRPSGSVKECTQANVLQVRGTSRETRWYFVEALLTRRVRGWVPASFTLGAQQFPHAPDVIRDLGFHCGSAAKRLVDAAEIVER
jgi:hypothetical protein